MFHMRALGAALATALLSAGAAGADLAVDTNVWQVTSGNWSDGANWSLGHAPNDWEFVNVPDNGDISITLDSADCVCGCFYVDYRYSGGTSTLTISGGGSLTSMGSVGNSESAERKNDQCCIRTNRKLVLDGANLTIAGFHSPLCYAPIEVRNGATFEVRHSLYLWWTGSSLLIDNATVRLGGALYYRNADRFLRVDNGGALISAYGITPYDEASRPLAITVANGSRIESPAGTLSLIDGCSFSLADTSTVSFAGFPQASGDADVTYALTGGTYTVAGACTTADLAFMEKSQGTKFLFSGAINTGETAGEILEWKGDLSVPTIRLYGVPTLRFEDDATLEIGQFINYATNNAFTEAWMPCIDCRNIVFTKDTYPFTTSGNQRYAHLLGPVTMRSRVDIPRNAGKNTYTLVTGDVVIDTSDPDDPAVTHTLDIKTLGPCDYATLTLRGGGKVTLGVALQAHRFQRVTVEEGTTLEIISPDGGTDWGTLNTEAFTMKAGATLRLSVESGGDKGLGRGARVTAHKWSLDPTASVVVTNVSKLASGARALLDGDSTDSLPANAASLVTIEGEAEGWSVLQGNGAVYVSKSTGEVDGAYAYEWTGKGTSRYFSESANWYANAVPVESKPMFFGAGDAYTALTFNHIWNASDTTKHGSTVGSLNFRETAVKAFSITGNQPTFSRCGYLTTPSDWSVSTESFVPQRVGTSLRTGGGYLSLLAAHGSLTVGNGKSEAFTNKKASAEENTGELRVMGDVRVWANTPNNLTNQIPRLLFVNNNLRISCLNTGVGSRYTVIGSGTTQIFSGQTRTLEACSGLASLAVNEGAKLVFNDKTTGQTAAFDWGATKPTISRIDGTLELNVPFVAQVSQFYAGAGTIAFNKTATLKSNGAVATVGFADALDVNLPADAWQTATAATPAGALSITAEGAPTLHTGGNWTYGVPAGVTATSSAADRALKLEAGATLTIDAGEGTATIAEDVTGRGTLVMTNGTLAVSGAIGSRIGLEIASGASFVLGSSQSVKAFVAKPGATLTMGEGAVLAAAGDIDLTGATVNFASLPVGRWTRVMTYGGTFAGTDLPLNCEARTVALAEGGHALELKQHAGSVLLLK